ncbi:MAG: hypothetical protein ACOVO1_06575 [Chitinophagaceae bacterium]
MKKIFFILILLSNIVFAQTSKTTWKLYNGNKVVAKGVAGKQKEFLVSNKNKALLKLKCYPSINLKKWLNTLIIMDTNRVELARKNIETSDNGLVIKKEYLDSNKKILCYISSKPLDPKLAARVRVGTVLLITIKLLN